MSSSRTTNSGAKAAVSSMSKASGGPLPRSGNKAARQSASFKNGSSKSSNHQLQQQREGSASPAPMSPTWGTTSPPTMSTMANMDSNVFTPNATSVDITTGSGGAGMVNRLMGGLRGGSGNKSIGAKMKSIREGKGLSVEDVAAALGIPAGGGNNNNNPTTTDDQDSHAHSSSLLRRPHNRANTTFNGSATHGSSSQADSFSSPLSTTIVGVGSLTSIEDGTSGLESWSRIFFRLAINLQVPVDALLPAITSKGYPLPSASRVAAMEAAAANSSAIHNNRVQSSSVRFTSTIDVTADGGGEMDSSPSNGGGDLSRTATASSLGTMSPLGGTTTTIQSCGGRLRDIRQRSGLTGMEVTEGTRLTTAELLGLEAANTNSAYEKWGSLLGRFCLLTMTSAFSLMSSACVYSLLEGGNEDGSGSECSEAASDREAAFRYSVEDLIGDVIIPQQPKSTKQPFSATTANYSLTAKGGGGMGATVMDEDDAFGLNPAFVFGT